MVRLSVVFGPYILAWMECTVGDHGIQRKVSVFILHKVLSALASRWGAGFAELVHGISVVLSITNMHCGLVCPNV